MGGTGGVPLRADSWARLTTSGSTLGVSASTASRLTWVLRVAADGGNGGFPLLVDVALAQVGHDLLARLARSSWTAAGRLPSSRMTCQPNCDCTGSRQVARLWPARTRRRQTRDPCPSRRTSRACPPFWPEDGIVGISRASLRMSAPAAIFARVSLASFLASSDGALLGVEQDVRRAHLCGVACRPPCRRDTARARASRSARCWRRTRPRPRSRCSRPRDPARKRSTSSDESRGLSGADVELGWRAPAPRATSARACGPAGRSHAGDCWRKPSRRSGGSFSSSASYSARVTEARLLEMSTVSGACARAASGAQHGQGNDRSAAGKVYLSIRKP